MSTKPVSGSEIQKRWLELQRARGLSRRDLLRLAFAGWVSGCTTAQPSTTVTEAATGMAEPWLANGREMGLGTSNFDEIDVVELTL